MLSIKYYRQYLWIFFYMFFILMAVALGVDYLKSDGSAKIKLVRFLTVLVCFLFSGAGILIQNYSARRLLGIKFLNDRKFWFKRRMKVTKRKSKKTYRKFFAILFCMSNFFANLVMLLPLVAALALMMAGKWDSDVKGKFCDPIFMGVSLLIKYFSWYITLLTSRFSMFFRKKRINNLI